MQHSPSNLHEECYDCELKIPMEGTDLSALEAAVQETLARKRKVMQDTTRTYALSLVLRGEPCAMAHRIEGEGENKACARKRNLQKAS